MAGLAKQYDPKSVYFSYAGNLLGGYADGDFFSAKRNADNQMLMVGADGETCFIMSADKSGEVTLTLLRSSASNDILSALYKAQELEPVAKPLWAKDGRGTSIVAGNQALIKKLPDLTFAKEMSTVEWVFVVADLEVHIGGSI